MLSRGTCVQATKAMAAIKAPQETRPTTAMGVLRAPKAMKASLSFTETTHSFFDNSSTFWVPPRKYLHLKLCGKPLFSQRMPYTTVSGLG